VTLATGHRPGVAVRGRRRFRPPAILRGDNQAPRSLCTCDASDGFGLRAWNASSERTPSELPTGTLQRFRPPKRTMRVGSGTSPDTSHQHAVIVARSRYCSARVASMETSGWRRSARLGSVRGFGQWLRWARCRGRVSRWRERTALRRGSWSIQFVQAKRCWSPWVLGSAASCGRGVMATSSRSCGARSCTAAFVRSRGSPFGFARAMDFELRVFTVFLQLRGGNIATRVSGHRTWVSYVTSF
jgi:hypothetical protein